MKGIQAATVDEYMARVPDEQRPTLERLRELVRSVAPDSAESISYGIPTYKLNGKPLVYFGTAQKHYALYAISGVVREAHKEALEGYKMSKGTIRFPFAEPFPAALIQKLVKAQMVERKAAGKK